MKAILILPLLAVVVATGCRRSNGIDNNNVIRTPYALFIGDREGSMTVTNNGRQFKTVFLADGYAARSLLVSDTNLLMVKNNVFLSDDNALHFNPTDYTATPNAFYQSIMLDVPSHNRIYLASTSGYGVKYSTDHGRTWNVDLDWETSITDDYSPKVHSFAQLTNGKLFAWDNVDSALYLRESVSDRWELVPYNGLPTGRSNFFLSRYNNTLILVDSLGNNGVRFSTDAGSSWSAYPGLPKKKLFAAYAPFEQGLLVGTDSMGVYRLENGVFLPSNGGLDINTSVYSIAAKMDTYKNDNRRGYVYIATNTGLYRSEDGGVNWEKVIEGDFYRVY